jgi:glycosyl transferase family 4
VKRAAFVVPHPYVDALACFREPVKRLAAENWQVDLFTTLSPVHPAPAFASPRVNIVAIAMTKTGAARLVARLIAGGYDWIFAVPQWALHYATLAASAGRVPVVCISDELTADREATTALQQQWRRRERRAHQRCAFTIALSGERADFIRRENQLGAEHEIFVVPNAAPGPAERAPSRFYQDLLRIPCEKRIVLHAGSWWWKRLGFADLERVAGEWSDGNVLVLQGRLVDHLPAGPASGNVRINSTILPSDLLDYAVSSAHIGLAMYDTMTANTRAMGTASGKIAVYMKNLLPVIAVAHPSLDWIAREGCGLLVDGLDGIDAAAGRIAAAYEWYVGNVKRVYDERLDFNRTFQPVLDRLEIRARRG